LGGSDGSGLLNEYLGSPKYMSPELEALKSRHAVGFYKGVSVDLFAAGVVLFVMYTGCFPFSSATSKDAFYKHFF